MVFNIRMNIVPDVLWHSPYNKSTTRILFAAILGLKIDQNNIVAVCIPLPHPHNSMTQNNSIYRTGIIPVSHIDLNDITLNRHFRQRTRHIGRTQPMAIALRKTGAVIIPWFAHRNVDVNIIAHQYCFTVQTNVNDNRIGFTYTAHLSNATPKYPIGYAYL